VGQHDMQDAHTWVCAICEEYDPVLPPDAEDPTDDTQWIGCDCGRWFHLHCTGLKEESEDFSCSATDLECLPPEED